MSYIERVLDTYTLEEIFEYNEVTEAEVLTYLISQEFISLPSPTPVDLVDE